MNTLGHNERSYRLDALASEISEGYKDVDRGSEAAIEGWLRIGRAMNEARALFPGDREFGRWVAEHVLGQLGQAEIHPKEREAAMWAAANADQFAEARAAGDARTVRGIHKQWKKIEADRKKAKMEEERRLRNEAAKAEREKRAEAARKAKEEAEKQERDAIAAAESAADDAEREAAQARADEAATAKAQAQAEVDVVSSTVIEPDPAPDPYADERKDLSQFTREGLEDLLIEARRALGDEKTKRKKAEAERNDYKAKWQEATADGDMGRKLGNAQRQRDTAKARLHDEQAKNAVQQRRINAMDAELKKLRAERENQVFPL